MQRFLYFLLRLLWEDNKNRRCSRRYKKQKNIIIIKKEFTIYRRNALQTNLWFPKVFIQFWYKYFMDEIKDISFLRE